MEFRNKNIKKKVLLASCQCDSEEHLSKNLNS